MSRDEPVDVLLRDAAWELSTYAASINWSGGRNTEDWLAGLEELIERVQAICKERGLKCGMAINPTVLPSAMTAKGAR